MENHTEGAVMASGDAPVITRFGTQCATATKYQSVGSPSLPNYIGATAGDTFGINDDASPSDHSLQSDNLFRQVRAMGKQARSYQEDMPSNCSLTNRDRYAVKHNPEAYFAAPADRRACLQDNVPLGTIDAGPFAHDLDGNSLAAFTFVTPNLCNDTHDCDVATGDRWLGTWLPRILSSSQYRSGNTAVFVVWDEPSPMPFVAIAPTIAAGTVITSSTSHFALLRTTEELLGVPTFLGQASAATSLRPQLHI